jgi:hypothetical protein
MSFLYLVLYFSLIPLTDFLLNNIKLSNIYNTDKNKKQSIACYIKKELMGREDIYFMLIFLTWFMIFTLK